MFIVASDMDFGNVDETFTHDAGHAYEVRKSYGLISSGMNDVSPITSPRTKTDLPSTTFSST